MKPITVALALEKDRVTLSEELPAYNQGKKDKDGYYPKGKIMLDSWNISDKQQFKTNRLKVEDIVVESSTIGALQIAHKLTIQRTLFDQLGKRDVCKARYS